MSILERLGRTEQEIQQMRQRMRLMALCEDLYSQRGIMWRGAVIDGVFLWFGISRLLVYDN